LKKEMLINVCSRKSAASPSGRWRPGGAVRRAQQPGELCRNISSRNRQLEPSIQAAFVDFGIGRNGFLHVSDVEPAYYRPPEQSRGDQGNRRADVAVAARACAAASRRRKSPTCSPEPEPLSDALTAGLEDTAAEPEPRSGRETPIQERGRSRGRSRRGAREHRPAARTTSGRAPRRLRRRRGSKSTADADRKPPAQPPDGSRRRGSEVSCLPPSTVPRKATTPKGALSAGVDDSDIFFPRSTPASGESQHQEPATRAGRSSEAPLRTAATQGREDETDYQLERSVEDESSLMLRPGKKEYTAVDEPNSEAHSFARWSTP